MIFNIIIPVINFIGIILSVALLIYLIVHIKKDKEG